MSGTLMFSREKLQASLQLQSTASILCGRIWHVHSRMALLWPMWNVSAHVHPASWDMKKTACYLYCGRDLDYLSKYGATVLKHSLHVFLVVRLRAKKALGKISKLLLNTLVWDFDFRKSLLGWVGKGSKMSGKTQEKNTLQFWWPRTGWGNSFPVASVSVWTEVKQWYSQESCPGICT